MGSGLSVPPSQVRKQLQVCLRRRPDWGACYQLLGFDLGMREGWVIPHIIGSPELLLRQGTPREPEWPVSKLLNLDLALDTAKVSLHLLGLLAELAVASLSMHNCIGQVLRLCSLVKLVPLRPHSLDEVIVHSLWHMPTLLPRFCQAPKYGLDVHPLACDLRGISTTKLLETSLQRNRPLLQACSLEQRATLAQHRPGSHRVLAIPTMLFHQ
mmetsp:Transcript_32998/g.84256  ORF Transcript_32998/g.84256 Transcript_32998/m.84256 type:complete len:212 (+) Transcript_32998:1020-1655(+)